MLLRSFIPYLLLSMPLGCDSSKDALDDCVSSDEFGDGIDQNCDGIDGIDEDGDGFASLASGGLDCDDTDSLLSPIDLDEDGFSTCDGDCDDMESTAFPGAAEADSPDACMLDRDDDGYGDAAPQLETVDSGTDCDDADASLTPADVDADGQSSCVGDCDDEDSTVYIGAAYHEDSDLCTRDADGDGWGDSDVAEWISAGSDCNDSDASLNRDDADQDGQDSCSGDCNDSDAFVFVGAAELDDIDACMRDQDQDGWGESNVSTPVVVGTDCNDVDDSVHPQATETCDGVDNNCNGAVDLNDATLDYSSAISQYIDSDDDGYGDPLIQSWYCAPEVGWVDNNQDCNDSNPDIRPNALEICDQIDNDCDLAIDDADSSVDLSTGGLFYADNDSDGYGTGQPIESCLPPMGWVDAQGDCNDSNALVHPMADEVCDGIDNDCDGDSDDADTSLDLSTASAYWLDSDADSYGSGPPVFSCDVPLGFVSNENDCNDQDPNIHPQSQEFCDGIDNDCDALVDDFDPDVNLSTAPVFYPDADADGQGGMPGQPACLLPSGYVTNALDCDDGNAFTYTGAASQDDPSLCMTDADLDGYGDASALLPIEAGTDCVDTDAAQNIGASDSVGDGLDNNCDGVDGVDGDGDGYASTASGGLDCDDLDALVHPFATEIVNDGIDQDCNGLDSTGPVADFSLEDLNPNSPRFGQMVSPRDYLQQVSGWYYIKAT